MRPKSGAKDSRSITRGSDKDLFFFLNLCGAPHKPRKLASLEVYLKLYVGLRANSGTSRTRLHTVKEASQCVRVEEGRLFPGDYIEKAT